MYTSPRETSTPLYVLCVPADTGEQSQPASQQDRAAPISSHPTPESLVLSADTSGTDMPADYSSVNLADDVAEIVMIARHTATEAALAASRALSLPSSNSQSGLIGLLTATEQSGTCPLISCVCCGNKACIVAAQQAAMCRQRCRPMMCHGATGSL